MFGPLRVKTPVPAFVTAIEPLPSAITPEKVVVELLPPVVRTTAVAVDVVTLPVPANEPTVSLNPARSRVPLGLIVTALVPPIPLAIESFRVPALMIVAPVYVCATPNVSVPAPSLVTPPVPEMMPADFVVLPAPSTVSAKPAVATAPLSVSVPAVATTVLAEPRVKAPDQVLVPATLRSAPVPDTPEPLSVSGSATARPLPLSVMAAPETTVAPVPVAPRAALLWTSIVPAPTEVAPA